MPGQAGQAGRARRDYDVSGLRPDLTPQASSLKSEFSSLPLKPVAGNASEKVECPLFPQDILGLDNGEHLS